ncbi:MAG: hypothetical protein SWQ30_00690 [Thermodesulfobacteriota bacterium]|nr:hypothetical protein [Thermodesulfobacteriota bacterium]
MKPELLYQHLENLLEQLDITIVYDNLSDAEGKASSGLCRVKGRHVYMMDKGKALTERIRLLRECLCQVDIDKVYVLPAVREFLEKGGGMSNGP